VALLLVLAACNHAAGSEPSGSPHRSANASHHSDTPDGQPSGSPDAPAIPPAYLIWTHDGLPPGLQPRLAALPGVERAVTVGDDTAWMTRSVDAAGTVVDAPASPFAIPLETQDADPHALAPFLPDALRDDVVTALDKGQGVLGETSARLRHIGVGGKLIFGNRTVTIGAVVPDTVANWSELLVSRDVGKRLGIAHDRFALIRFSGSPTEAAVSRSVLPLLPAGSALEARAPGKAEFRKNGDTVFPYVLMKVGFGEFAARPDPANPGYLQMDPAFVHSHLRTRTVPLLGAVTCNKVVFPALDAAMQELQRRGLSSLVHSFAGCYSARMVNRVPTMLLSHHSWGAAVDINAPENPFGARPTQDPRLVALMHANGFAWGGLWVTPDGMHFEFRPAHVAAPWPRMP
jgi:hypothetical protein